MSVLVYAGVSLCRCKFMYRTESWTITKKMTRKIYGNAGVRTASKMLNAKWQNEIRNKIVKRKTHCAIT